ncbi:hypothetical protein E6H36_09915 [Candidatus Bathyarchaeota archaeon]|nr:MAG: hypothetical protein E6H36_09915 [Candidatus Bathyarchaeota archaeon]
MIDRLKRRPLFIVSIIIVAFVTISAFLVMGLPALSPCSYTRGTARLITIVADLDGYNDSKSMPGQWPLASVNRCDPVTIRFTNQDIQSHGLAVDSYDVKGLTLTEGTTQFLNFTATRTGQFRVYCNIFCTVHTYMQNGLLIVT